MALSCMKVSRIIHQNAFRCLALSTQRNQSTETNEKLITTKVNCKTGFVTVSFNRPKEYNCFTLEMLQEFGKILDEVDSKSSRGMILTTVSYNYSFLWKLVVKNNNISDIRKCLYNRI